MKLNKQNILIISNEKWGKMWYSKHNYANELSKNNHVYFLNPPQPFHPFNLFKKNITSYKVTDTLTVLEYNNILPPSLFSFWKINDAIILKKINAFFKKNKITNLIFWTFDPIRLSQPELLKPSKIILHAVDAYLFKYPSEELLAQKSDVIFCVSKEISESYKKYNKNVHTIPHGIPSDEFLDAKTKNKKDTTGIFVGNNDERIDFEFTKNIIEHFPQITFKFIGKINIDISKTFEIFSGKYPNVIVEDAVHYKELKHKINDADFCFIFKKVNYPGNNISSHKMLVYLAQAKPIFSTVFSEFKDNSHLLYMTNELSKTIENINNFLLNEEQVAIMNDRRNYARKYTYENIINSIENLL